MEVGTPDFVNDITHAIIEVDSSSSTVAKEGGFTSESPTRNGKILHQGRSRRLCSLEMGNSRLYQ